MPTDELQDVAYLFALLAEIDFRGASPLYERLARDSAEEPELLALLLPAAPRDRLPHLLFAAVQYLLLGEGADPLDTFGDKPSSVFRAWCLARRSDIERLTASRVVQTNEVGRCAALLPCLATVAERVMQPLAVVEVGASAGLNLRFDRYRYVFGPGLETGAEDTDVVLRPRLQGGRVPPVSTPEVAWRRGLDRQPVDVTDDNAVRWLRACIWPEQRWRIELFERAAALARHDPPQVEKGDVYESLPAMVGHAPEQAALCVVHTAFLSYLPDQQRFGELLAELARERPIWWVSGEGTGLVPQLPAPPPPPTPAEGISFLYGVVPLGVPGEQPRALARAGAHGAWFEWLDVDSPPRRAAG
ncbi:MAG TPA: DUF2332 domain-containing protein [Acidimicrobiales bacterium]